MLPEVGLPMGLTAAAVVVKFRLWPLMAEGFGRKWKAERREEGNSGGNWWWWKVGVCWGI